MVAMAMTAAAGTDMMTARERMIRDDIAGRGVRDVRVLQALREVAREEFVPADLRSQAYPLPIGHGQTISQPYIVAAMTELARIEQGSRVLEVGTGSGYQAAILARLGAEVFSIELVEALGNRAALRLQRLGYTNVQVRIGDGYLGWPERAPFDAILVTCGAPHVPPPLLEQLKPGGRMVIPVGPEGGVQSLQLIEKLDASTVRTEDVMSVRFVPLVRR
jgi:protein-L-isoaspartate(D-aspartate) O-methyltransferase